MKKISRSLTLGRRDTMKTEYPAESFPKPVCTNFRELHVDERRSRLAQVVCRSTLPIAIRMTKNYAAKNAAIALKSGEMLLLCFVIKVETVHATMGKTDYRLPLYCTQLFEPLPLDPLLDDKDYKGTKALIEAHPLPDMVRIVDAEYSPDPMAYQNAGDVIKIRQVELQDHPERGRERVLVGFDSRDQEVRFSEAMDMATYSTMISQDLLPLSELVKLAQRVRMPEATSSDDGEPKRNRAKEKIMKLHRFYTEYHVVAARARDDELLSIPINSVLEFECFDATTADIAQILPALFNRMNPTWCVTDISQPRLPESLSPVPQPIEGVFDAWAKSYEGKVKINQKYQVNINSMKKTIEEKVKEINKLKQQIAHPTAGPALHSRRTSFPDSVPPRPPRESRHNLPGPPNVVPPQQSLKPKPLPKPTTKPTSTYDILAKVSQQSGDEERSKLEDTIQQLRKDIHEKETKIFELLTAERKQKERYEVLLKERDELLTSRTADREQILQLQAMIDHMHNVQDGVIYEDIDQPVSNSTYSTPYTGKKVDNKMSVRDVGDFLRQINLSQYLDIFAKEQIDGMMLKHLDEEIMTSDLGMRRIDARKLVTRMGQSR